MKKFALLLAAACLALAAQAQLAVQNLRCENLADPVGLGQMQPRFSWQLAAGGRGVLQAARIGCRPKWWNGCAKGCKSI